MKRKRNSLASKQSEGEKEDRISKLPDELIHQILSSVDMKYAVQTSLLSKRWKNVWKSLPFISLNGFLIFDGKAYNIKDTVTLSRLLDRFVAFVDKVFDLRDNSDIQMIKLQLLIINHDLLETLNRWIRAAVDCNVQHLNINVGFTYLEAAYEIPHQLLNCKSLKSLAIKMAGVPLSRRISLILPKEVSLPQLKKLGLARVSISNLELQRILSSCPLLENVFVRRCDIQMENKRNMTIDSRSLRVIDLAENRNKHLCPAGHSLTYTATISAPNAKYLRFAGFMIDDFSLNSLFSLARVRFETTLRGREEDETANTYSELPAKVKEVFAKRMMKLLGAVHNVQHLTLSSGFLEVLLQGPGALYHQPPQLCNLEILNLEMRFTRGCLSSIAYLLKLSPILTSLKLKSKESNVADVRDDDWKTGLSSTCTFSHLKFVEIREVEGRDNELNFLSFLLAKSPVLEKVNVFFRSTSNSLVTRRQVRGFKRNLGALPTASSSIQLKIF